MVEDTVGVITNFILGALRNRRFLSLYELNTAIRERLKRLIKRAKFAEYDACTENIEYHSDRNLDAAQITRLATCEYINERHNILLLGATGSGKTYIACALGMAAVRRFLEGRYVEVAGAFNRACRRQGQRNLQKGDPAVQETLAAHP